MSCLPYDRLVLLNQTCVIICTQGILSKVDMSRPHLGHHAESDILGVELRHVYFEKHTGWL